MTTSPVNSKVVVDSSASRALLALAYREGLFALADQLELRLAKARGQVDKLTPSLLARAFRGQLVPQAPTDEPAEKLLERIRHQKREQP